MSTGGKVKLVEGIDVQCVRVGRGGRLPCGQTSLRPRLEFPRDGYATSF